jgi:hypothetical protein
MSNQKPAVSNFHELDSLPIESNMNDILYRKEVFHMDKKYVPLSFIKTLRTQNFWKSDAILCFA